MERSSCSLSAPRCWVSSVLLALLLACQLASSQKIRLAEGPDAQSGRLEIFYNNKWGVLCSTSKDALDKSNIGKVACRELGLPPVLTMRTPYASISQSAVNSSVPIWLQDVSCNGYERNVASCYVAEPWGSTTCLPNQDIFVSCKGRAPTVSLVNGSKPYIGRVAVDSAGVPSFACGGFFDMNDATVLCRQLNFGPPVRVFPPGTFGTGSIFPRYSRLLCSGVEASLEDCRNDNLQTDNLCPITLAAAVECTAPGATVSQQTTASIPTQSTNSLSGGRSSSPNGSQGSTGTGNSSVTSGGGVQDMGSTSSWGSDGRSIALIVILVLVILALVAVAIALIYVLRRSSDKTDGSTASSSEKESKPKRVPPRPPVKMSDVNKGEDV